MFFTQDEQELAPPPTDSKLTSLRQQQTDSTDGGEPPSGGPQPPGPSVTAPPSVTNAYSRQVAVVLCANNIYGELPSVGVSCEVEGVARFSQPCHMTTASQ